MSIFRKTRAVLALCAAITVADEAVSITAPACAQTAQAIRTIVVTGNSRIEAETVKHYLTFQAEDRYDAQKADASIKALFATGFFSDVRIKFEAGAVTVSVKENPLINRVAFEGNKDVKNETLTKAVKTKAGTPLSLPVIQTDMQRVLDAYRQEGYYAAQVNPKTVELDHNRADVIFEIREGEQTKIAGINFIGNRSFSDATLRSVISESESGLLDFLKSGTAYDPDRLTYDRELLRRYYIKNGFADMRVISAIADMDKEGKGFFITFSLEEGPRYTFGALEIESAIPALKAEALRSRIKGQPGDIYNAEFVDKSVEALTLTAGNAGQPFSQIRPRIERDQVSRTISVTYVVDQASRVYIERIDIVGNTRTLDSVIRREFQIAEGAPYNKVLVEAARQRLLKLGYFKEVTIVKEAGSAADRVRLSVDVREEQTGQLAFSGGYSTTQGVIGEISYTERNLMGTGQYLEVKLSGSMSGDGAFTISWTEPRFLEQNLAFGADIFVKNADYTAASGYTIAGYEDFRVGGSLRLGFALDDNFSVGTNYTLQYENVYNADPNASLAVKQIEGPAIISSIGYSSTYDTRNNKKKPTSGIYIKTTQDFAGVGGNVDYLRSTADIRAYYPISPDITLAFRAQGGEINGLFGQSVRVVDAFYKGSETIPGFAAAGIGPRDAATGDALGGTTFYSATTELRFPLPFLPQDIGLSGAVFASTGTLFGTDAQKFASIYATQHRVANTLAIQDTAALRSSAGGSLVWDSPVGNLRVDFAGVLSKAPFDKTQVVGFGYSAW